MSRLYYQRQRILRPFRDPYRPAAQHERLELISIHLTVLTNLTHGEEELGNIYRGIDPYSRRAEDIAP